MGGNEKRTLRIFLVLSFLPMLIVIIGLFSHRNHSPEDKLRPRRNVLLIIADDMRADIGAFIDRNQKPWLNPNIYTPNIDELASHSFLFSRAYTQQALCNPSRTAVLTGRRPDTTGVIDNLRWFRNTSNPDTVTLPQYFKQNNYTVDGLGKIYHLLTGFKQDMAKSWTRFKHFHSKIPDELETGVWRAVPEEVTNETPLMDQLLTQDALATLKSNSELFNKTGQNFFMAVGYRRPHLPWIFPENFLQYYPLESVDLPANPSAPYEMPVQAWFKSEEIINRLPATYVAHWNINSTLPVTTTKELRRAYYSCISFIDHEIGLLMAEVKRLGLLEDTVIAFFGDHGWQIGEHGVWGKSTNFEEATNAPLVIRVPGLTDKGIRSSQLVEFVDIFPTLSEAAGLHLPPQCPMNGTINIDTCVEGTSLMPLIEGKKTWKNAVFSQYPFVRAEGHYLLSSSMGYSIRTDRYRYTEWWNYNDTVGAHPEATELFDLDEDPFENYNRFTDRRYSRAKGVLSKALRAGWRSFIPT